MDEVGITFLRILTHEIIFICFGVGSVVYALEGSIEFYCCPLNIFSRTLN